VFAQVQQEVRGSAGRRAASPRPSVPQELYVALGADIGVHHFLPVAAAVWRVTRYRWVYLYLYDNGIAVGIRTPLLTTTVNYFRGAQADLRVRALVYFVRGNGTREWKCARNPLTPYTADVKNSGGPRRLGPRQTTEINAARHRVRCRHIFPFYHHEHIIIIFSDLLRLLCVYIIIIIIMLTVVCAASSSSSSTAAAAARRPKPPADRISDLRWCQRSRTFSHLYTI